MKGTIPWFKTSEYKGGSDKNLHTDDLALGPTLEKLRTDRILPTFDDLLRGLQHLPTGLDARGLTQCLEWYTHHRDMFKPPLQLNVIHTLSLIRALRQPLKPFGPQNLDRNALQEWQDNGRFEECEVHFESKDREQKEKKRLGRPQLQMNTATEDVRLSFDLPLRHVLTFPFLALHSVMTEAFKLGIQKGKARRRKKTIDSTKNVANGEPASRAYKDRKETSVDIPAKAPITTPKPSAQTEPEAPVAQSYQIPKRPRPVDRLGTPDTLPKRPKLAPAPIAQHQPQADTFTRPSPYTQRGHPAYPAPVHSDNWRNIPTSSSPYTQRGHSTYPAPSHSDNWRNTPAPSTQYTYHRQPQDTVYGRRDYYQQLGYRQSHYAADPRARSQYRYRGGEGYDPEGRYHTENRDRGRYDNGYRRY